MSIMPNARTGSPMSPVARTVVFWALMVALAAVIWKTPSNSPRGKPEAMSYSDFMAEVDNNNVRTANLVVSQSAAEIQGQLRQPDRKFRVTIPKEVIPDLAEKLRKQGASVEVSQKPSVSLATTIVNLLPIFLIVGAWIFLLRRRWVRQNPPAPGGMSPEPSSNPSLDLPRVPSNRPLG